MTEYSKYRKWFALVAILAGPIVSAHELQADDKTNCLKTLKAMGTPHPVKPVAQINAIRAWTGKSVTKGEKYGMWHNARETSLDCSQPRGSLVYRCMAAARPCLSSKAGDIPPS